MSHDVFLQESKRKALSLILNNKETILNVLTKELISEDVIDTAEDVYDPATDEYLGALYKDKYIAPHDPEALPPRVQHARNFEKRAALRDPQREVDAFNRRETEAAIAGAGDTGLGHALLDMYTGPGHPNPDVTSGEYASEAHADHMEDPETGITTSEFFDGVPYAALPAAPKAMEVYKQIETLSDADPRKEELRKKWVYAADPDQANPQAMQDIHNELQPGLAPWSHGEMIFKGTELYPEGSRDLDSPEGYKEGQYDLYDEDYFGILEKLPEDEAKQAAKETGLKYHRVKGGQGYYQILKSLGIKPTKKMIRKLRKGYAGRTITTRDHVFYDPETQQFALKARGKKKGGRKRAPDKWDREIARSKTDAELLAHPESSGGLSTDDLNRLELLLQKRRQAAKKEQEKIDAVEAKFKAEDQRKNRLYHRNKEDVSRIAVEAANAGLSEDAIHKANRELRKYGKFLYINPGTRKPTVVSRGKIEARGRRYKREEDKRIAAEEKRIAAEEKQERTASDDE